MHPDESPGDRDEEGPTWTGSELEDEAPQEPEPEPEPRSGSIPPPGATIPPPGATIPPPAVKAPKRGGGLLARLRSKLGR